MTTLLAVTGLSPAIVTETIWALAKREPKIIPERVIFITTATGVAKLEEQIFAARPDWNDLSVWDALRQSLTAPDDSLIAEPPAVISLPDPESGRARPLDDIRSPEENNAAAEFIFGQVWNVVRDRDRRLVASVAGGRKTMGALLHSAVSLIGRESDLLTHILVEPPFDTLPNFFFPGQPGGPVTDRFGKKHPTSRAQPVLADVPFVPLRNRFKELDDLPGSFLSLREKLADTLARDAERPVPIVIDHARLRLTVDGRNYQPAARALAVLEFVLRCHEKGHTFAGEPVAPQELAAEAFVKWHAANSRRFPIFPSAKDFTARQLTRDLSDLRTLLRDAPWQPATRSFVQPPFKLREAPGPERTE